MKLSKYALSAWRLLLSPSMALVVGLPTIGYYTAATYVSLSGVEGSGPGLVIRAVSLLIIGAAFLFGWRYRASLPFYIIPGVVFLVIYFLRMIENVWFQGVVISHQTEKAFLGIVFSITVTSLLLSSIWRGFYSQDARIILSIFAGVFIFGVILNMEISGSNIDTGRLKFVKINPIALAYTCSSFILYYLIVAQRSWRSFIESAVAVPFLISIAALAQSRGMMISTTICVLIYMVMLPKKHLPVMSAIIFLFIFVAVLCIDQAYFKVALDAIYRIDPVNDESTAARASSFQGAINQFLTDPILGRYVDVIEKHDSFYPHNIYLESIMAVGIIGSIPFFLHLVFASLAALSILRLHHTNWIWTFIALLFFRDAIGAAASGSIWGNGGFWITSFLVIVIWLGHGKNLNQTKVRITSAQLGLTRA